MLIRPISAPLFFAAALLMAAPLTAAAQSAGPPDRDMRIYEIIEAASAERIEADIRMLAGFGTRNTMSDTISDTRGIGAARRWIKAEFDRISAECGGCLEVYYQENIAEGGRIPQPTNIVNVIAVAGYKVYWRDTSSPQWEHSRFVGDATQFIFENLVIDNYLFGVAAVGRNGTESPVSFPTFQGRR